MSSQHISRIGPLKATDWGVCVLGKAEKDIGRRLTGEFIETSLKTLEDIESRLLRLESGDEIGAERLADFKRDIHSIKGQGTKFGFPLITRIAHLLEDYLALSQRADAENARDICAFIGPMTKALRAGRTPSPEESGGILRSLPTYRARTFSPQKLRNVHVHLAMLPGLHVRIVSRELSSCGIRVTQSDNAVDSLKNILASPPDIVIASQELKGFSGVELARVMQALDTTRHIRFVLLTSCPRGDTRLSGLPREAATLSTNVNYAYSLGELLLKWDVFAPAKKIAPPPQLFRI